MEPTVHSLSRTNEFLNSLKETYDSGCTTDTESYSGWVLGHCQREVLKVGGAVGVLGIAALDFLQELALGIIKTIGALITAIPDAFSSLWDCKPLLAEYNCGRTVIIQHYVQAGKHLIGTFSLPILVLSFGPTEAINAFFSSENAVVELKEKLENLNASIKTKQKTIDTLTAQLSSQRETPTPQPDPLAFTNVNQEAFDAKERKLEQKIQDLKQKLQKAKEIHTQLCTQLETAEAEQATAQTNLNAKNTENLDLQNQIKNLQERLTQAQQQPPTTIQNSASEPSSPPPPKTTGGPPPPIGMLPPPPLKARSYTPKLRATSTNATTDSFPSFSLTSDTAAPSNRSSSGTPVGDVMSELRKRQAEREAKRLSQPAISQLLPSLPEPKIEVNDLSSMLKKSFESMRGNISLGHSRIGLDDESGDNDWDDEEQKNLTLTLVTMVEEGTPDIQNEIVQCVDALANNEADAQEKLSKTIVSLIDKREDATEDIKNHLKDLTTRALQNPDLSLSIVSQRSQILLSKSGLQPSQFGLTAQKPSLSEEERAQLKKDELELFGDSSVSLDYVLKPQPEIKQEPAPEDTSVPPKRNLFAFWENKMSGKAGS